MKALWITENEDKTFTPNVVERNIEDLPTGDVLIKVKYSSLNYKDALSASGNKGVTKNYPHTPGIDAAGIVESSTNEKFAKGDKVIVTGFDLGMNTSGGFGEYIRVPSEWVIKLPKGLKLKESMMFGTGGLTAALCIDKIIENGITPQRGKIIVTGSTGGVGIMAVMILAKLGYHVVAVSGKPEAKEILIKLGAKEVIGREGIDDKSNRPLLKGQYAGAVDTVGGNILASILKSMNYNGVISICGLVNSAELPTSVFPFILRGVSMFGIDSAECDIEWRKRMWKNLAKKWKPENLKSVIKTVTLNSLPKEIKKILKGGQIGRVVIRH